MYLFLLQLLLLLVCLLELFFPQSFPSLPVFPQGFLLLQCVESRGEGRGGEGGEVRGGEGREGGREGEGREGGREGGDERRMRDQ